MPNHGLIAFDELHKAKFDAGLAASLPSVPEGIGDAYLATDTEVLYIADAAGTAWVAYDLGAVAASTADIEDALFTAMIGL